MLLPSDDLLVPSVLDIDSEPLGWQKAEPLQGLLVETRVGERILPQGYAQMHDHKPEVVREAVSYEVPTAGEVLEPDLRLRLVIFLNVLVD